MIVIAPYSKPLLNGRTNAKSYPWWPQLIQLLDCDITQLGVAGEPRLEGVGQFVQGWPLRRVRSIIEDADGWLSVDSWLPHFCNAERLKAGVVLWGPSDPLIFGYAHNLNLLKSRDYLRPLQFQDWHHVPHDYNAFIRPELIAPQIHHFLTAQGARPRH